MAAVGIYATWVFSAALDVEKLLDQAESLDVSGIATGNENSLLAAAALVDDSSSATESLSRKLGPIRVADSVFGWIPWVGDQLSAPVLLVRRAKAALDSTEPLIAAANDFSALQKSISSGSPELNASADEFEHLHDSLQANAAETTLRMQRVLQEAAAMDGLTLLSIFQKRADRVTALERKLVAYGRLLDGSPDAISDARRVMIAGSEASALLTGTGELDLKALTAALDSLATTASESSASILALAEIANSDLPGTGIAIFSTSLAETITAVADLSSGLSEIAKLMNGSASVLEQANGPLFSDGATLKAALQPLVESKERTAQALERSRSAHATLQSLSDSGRADFLPQELTASLLHKTGRLLGATALLIDGPELMLDVFAAGSASKYLVLGQTSDELRAAGGFTSSVWTLSFEDGALKQTEFIPIVWFENRNVLSQAPPPPEPLSYYMNTGAMYLRDVGWDPDFTAVAQLAEDLYELHRGEGVDGVIGVTQWGIIELVESFGGLEVDGEIVSPEQTLEIIEQGTDIEGTIFLEDLFDSLLRGVDSSAMTDAEFTLIRAVEKMITRKDLMIYSSDPEQQKLLDSLDVTGRFPVTAADRIAVIDSNVGWSKSDRSISRSARYGVDLSDPGNPAAELTLSYRHSGSDVGRDCSEQRIPYGGEAVYSISRHSCYWNLFRAYIATGVEVTEHPELPLPAGSVPEQRDLQEPGTSTFSHVFDEYGDHLTGLVTVAPGDSIKFSFSYNLPRSVIQARGSGLIYELHLEAQPGARGRRTLVEVTLPEGYLLANTNHDAENTDGTNATFLFDLFEDELLQLEFLPDE